MISKIERRIAPFWKGLNDHSDSWTENQLIAAAGGLPIPAPDEIPSDNQLRSYGGIDSQAKHSGSNIHSLTVPISSRSQSYNSDTSSNNSPTYPPSSLPSPSSPIGSSSTGSALFRGRAKTLASLTTSSRINQQLDMTPREMNLPRDPYVNGQPIEAYLYKDAIECPICFLYYPPYLNRTRCCDQSICSECFVQIKRPDPHPPEHGDASAVPSVPAESPESGEPDSEVALVSEPAGCPFCVQPEFGVTYEPPHFRRGLTYVNQITGQSLGKTASAMSSSSSLLSSSGSGAPLSPTAAARRRTTSISATSPAVITTDRIRPDWAQKLSSARAHAARRSAAATALHTAAYLMGNRNHSPDARSFGGFGRRGVLRRATGADSPSGGPSSSHLNMLALMSERYAASAGARGDMATYGEGGPMLIQPPPRGGSRSNRMEDIEDMMMMEAIRLSLASEEDRRKREAKDAKKEAKKKDKENKKAEKMAKKAGIYQTSTTPSTTALDSPRKGASSIHESSQPNNGKGKAVQRPSAESSAEPPFRAGPFPLVNKLAPNESSNSEESGSHPERYRAPFQSNDPHSASTYKPSHLRNLSNASSSASSIIESIPGSLKNGGSHSSFEASPNTSGIDIPHGNMKDSFRSNTPPTGGASIEPVFNFRSLAAMIGDDDKADMIGQHKHVEEAGDDDLHRHQRGASSSSAEPSETKDSMTRLGQSIATIKPDSSSKEAHDSIEIVKADITEITP